MILQALKNMYPRTSEIVLNAVLKDLGKCRGKNMRTEELADWIGKLITAHTIEEALKQNILEKYARDNGFENTQFFVDDGYSGVACGRHKERPYEGADIVLKQVCLPSIP